MNVSMWHTFQFVLKSVCLDFFIVSVTVYFWLLIFMFTPVRYVIGIFNKCKKHEIGKNNKEKIKKKEIKNLCICFKCFYCIFFALFIVK